MNLFWWKEKCLRTVWRVEKDSHPSFLVGTAHFSPYSFDKALIKLIQGVETVLFEGPLDQESMAKVVQYGQQGENTPSIYKALDPAAIQEINRQLGTQSELPPRRVLIWTSSIQRLQIFWRNPYTRGSVPGWLSSPSGPPF